MTEMANRLQAVVSGPWAQEGTHARTYLRSFLGASRKGASLTAVRPRLSAGAAAKLAKVFRFHDRGITAQSEIDIRESYDEALTTLQLMEIAAECGYLSADDIAPAARAEFATLLFAPPLEQYLVLYDYFLVRFLAVRIGVKLALPAVDPPAPQGGGEVRFSTFLGYHKRWYGDAKLDTWLGYLDDYGPTDLPDLDATFERLLLKGSAGRLSAAHREHLADIREGMLHFYRLLGSLFGVASPEERRYWGLMYAYWMAKAFGFELTESGYEKEGLDLGGTYEEALKKRGQDLAALAGSSTGALMEEYQLVRRSWDEVHAFVSSHMR